MTESMKTLNLMCEPREEPAGIAARPRGGYRRVICGLLFVATAINDVHVIHGLAPRLAPAAPGSERSGFDE